MRKRVALIGCCLLFAAALPCLADEGTRHYREVHGQSSAIVDYGTEKTDTGYRVSAIGADSTEIVQWLPASGVVSWHLKDAIKKFDLVATRSGDTIIVKGAQGGKDIAREIRVDQAPWYQIFGPVIDQLLPGVQGQREFWVVNPDDLSAHKMQARRAGTERIDIRGTAVDTIKVHFSPAGALAPFWGADYWFRATDTVYVYSRLLENGGLTVTTIEEPLR